MIRLTCDACGGSLEIEPGQKVMMCPFCGAKFIERSVTNNISIANGQIHADAVNINADSLAKEAKLTAAEGHIRLGNYEVAYNLLQELLVYFPEDVRIRLAMFDCVSMNRTREDYNKAEFDELEKQYETIAQIDKEKKKEIQSCYTTALDKLRKKQNQVNEIYYECEEIDNKSNKYIQAFNVLRLLTIILFIISFVIVFLKPKLALIIGGLVIGLAVATFICKIKQENLTGLADDKRVQANALDQTFEEEGIRF